MVRNTFEKYMEEPHSLSMKQMQDIHRKLIEEIGKDPDAVELYEELIAVATRYAAIRAGWQLSLIHISEPTRPY